MPEFEEPEAATSSKENYTPSTDATQKPRTRRRSGGFKTEIATLSSDIGEVEAAEALKKEKLSGGAKPEPKPKKEKKTAPKSEKPERKREKPSPKVGNAKPSPETLAAIERVEARIAERKKERDARRAGRDKNRSGRSDQKPSGKRSSSAKKPQSGGIIASILGFFGLGTEQPATTKGGPDKRSSSRGQASRPRGSGSNGSRGQGKKRQGSGKGRRSGGKGPRRSDRASQNNQS